MSTAVELERLGRTQQLELQLTNFHFLSNPSILMSVQAMMNTTRITQAAFASLWSLTLSNISCPTWIRKRKNRPNLYRLTEPQTKCMRTYPDFITGTDSWDFMRKISRTNCSFPWFPRAENPINVGKPWFWEDLNSSLLAERDFHPLLSDTYRSKFQSSCFAWNLGSSMNASKLLNHSGSKEVGVSAAASSNSVSPISDCAITEACRRTRAPVLGVHDSRTQQTRFSTIRTD